MNVEELRRRYPNPIRARPIDKDMPESYCVGGALCVDVEQFPYNEAILETRGAFPRRTHVAKALRKANPSLPASKALVIARHITEENDAGNFDVAWAWLRKGLEY